MNYMLALIKIDEGCISGAPTNEKEPVEENELLALHDYAWNKRKNRPERPEILNGN